MLGRKKRLFPLNCGPKIGHVSMSEETILVARTEKTLRLESEFHRRAPLVSGG